MKYIFIIITLIHCYLFSSCQSYNRESLLNNYTHTLQPSDTLYFNLDSATHNMSSSITYFEQEGKEYLAYFSESDNTIKYFDFETKNIVDKTLLNQEGTDGVGKNITGVSFINSDTILVSTGTYQMSIVNRDGKLKYKRSFTKPVVSEVNVIAEPDFSVTHKGIKLNHHIWIPVNAYISYSEKDEFTTTPSLYHLDLTNDKIKAVMRYPDVYTKGSYGLNFADFFFDYNAKKKSLIWSFAADESLHILDLMTNKVISQRAESKYFSEVPAANQLEEFEEYTKFFLLSNSYGPLYYDPYQKIYVRFAERAISKEQYNNREWWKKRSAIILNEDFKVLGEVEFSIYINHHMSFVTREAIYFLLTNDVEDKMTFVGFKLKNISE